MPPLDTVGQVQLEITKWVDRPTTSELWFTVPLIDYEVMRTVNDPASDGDTTINQLTESLEQIPGIKIEILKIVHIKRRTQKSF